jgi:hypothetical protein
LEAERLAAEKAKIEAERIAAEKAKLEAEKIAAAKKLAAERAAAARKLALEKYNQLIIKADQLFTSQRYAEAKKNYEEALISKVGDAYAKGRLVEIEKIMKSDEYIASEINQRQKTLLAKYPAGITEETITGNGVVIIQRVVVKNNLANVYQKKIFNWGGVSYFRDDEAITESTFEQETKR